MRTFMDVDFILSTNTAKKLYHNYAEQMPIIDYHCHINPKEIAENRTFSNLTELWLSADHYKWRQMRANGIDEFYITGAAKDYDKYLKWVETLEKSIGNPLYHWSHLELKRYFGYDGVLNMQTAPYVWDFCNNKLIQQNMCAKDFINMSNVKIICTTDDPADTLEWHDIIAMDNNFDVSVIPSWRPDKILNIESKDYIDYINRLSHVSNVIISDFNSLKSAIKNRMEFFKVHNCVVADHGLEYVMYKPATIETIDEIFKKVMGGHSISRQESLQFKTACNEFFAEEYSKLNWTMQLHYGCIRNSNTLLFERLGPDSGFDCMGNYTPADELVSFFNSLEYNKIMPKTILYSLNNLDNALIDTIINSFQDCSCAGKIQHGSAWWFNDHKAGIIEHLTSLANLGILGNFIGMLTDSRSFLSYTRHEYFRRILCDFIGNLVENGEYPEDYYTLGHIIQDICFYNAKNYFNFNI